MKKKTINKVINKKFDDFVSSITDENVRNLVNKNSIISGGCIASMLLQENVNDFDIYFTNKETVSAVARYYVNEFTKNFEAKHGDGKIIDIRVDDETDRVKIYIKSAGMASETSGDNYQYFETRSEDETNNYVDQVIQSMSGLDEIFVENIKDKFRPIFLSANAITLSDQIQLVLRFYGDPDNIHLHYDYVHCTNYWTSHDRKLVLKQDALEALMAKELIYIGSKYPICSVIRTRKFIKRGFSINAGQYLKMAFQISELNLKDFDVLEDQLTGVDVAYFYQLIEGLKNHEKSMKEKGLDFTLNYSYLVSIIDKIF